MLRWKGAAGQDSAPVGSVTKWLATLPPQTSTADKEPAELGQEEAFESAFDGDWVFNSQVHQIRGRGTDLRLGGSSCHFKQLTEKTCELFLFVQLGKLLHVVTGRLSDDRQRLTWNNGNEWRRVRENARFALPREDSDAELRLLRKENQYMRAKLIAAGLS